MKKSALLLLSMISFSCFAATANKTQATNCPQALPTDDLNFCSSFKEAATCHCTSMGLPAGLCQDMQNLNARMISMFGSLERACAFQKDTSKQTCIDDWNCYLNGGEDSNGSLCSSSGASCE
jgi:hypothetical protein